MLSFLIPNLTFGALKLLIGNQIMNGFFCSSDGKICIPLTLQGQNKLGAMLAAFDSFSSLDVKSNILKLTLFLISKKQRFLRIGVVWFSTLARVTSLAPEDYRSNGYSFKIPSLTLELSLFISQLWDVSHFLAMAEMFLLLGINSFFIRSFS